MENKLCPKRFGYFDKIYHNPNKYGLSELDIEKLKCLKEKCAWWIDWANRCSINQIAQGFYVDKDMYENPTRFEIRVPSKEKPNGK